MMLTPQHVAAKVGEGPQKKSGFTDFESYPSFYEHTHIEILRAKELMDAMGLRSAIMVSSPYHMARIRMISRKVFGEQARLLAYVPTRFERVPESLRGRRRADWMFIASEVIKICWFSLYSTLI